MLVDPHRLCCGQRGDQVPQVRQKPRTGIAVVSCCTVDEVDDVGWRVEFRQFPVAELHGWENLF